jgi:putative transposase
LQASGWYVSCESHHLMTRQIRIEFPGAVYHVTSRGNRKQDIFHGRRDFLSFMSILGRTADRYRWLVYAYCLMSNHYHILIETLEPSLCNGMRYLNTMYVCVFNKRHKRVGHTLQGRFHATLVDKESYLLEVTRYIVLNPVRAGLVKQPGQWEWSSYNATMGRIRKPRFLDSQWILSQLGQDPARSREAYREFVLGGLKDEPPWAGSHGGMILGSESFIESVRPFFETKERMKGIPRRQRFATRPPLVQLLQSEQGHKLGSRAIRMAREHYGYTLREIASFLGVHPTKLTRALRGSKSGQGSSGEAAP